MVIEVVKAGDTLYSIAEKNGTTPELIAQTNGIELWQSLVVGQAVLVLVPEIMHTVRDGDTLFSIAESYGITVFKLLANNPQINSGFPLFEGSELIIKYEGEPVRDMIVNGYAYPYITEELLRSFLPYLSFLTVFTYGITKEGTLIAIEDEDIIEAARLYEARPVMLVSTLTEEGVFSNELAHEILNDDERLNRLVEAVAEKVVQKNYGGVDVDFEFVYAEDSEKYARFIGLLRERLNPLGYPVIVALAPKTRDDQQGLIYEGHDYGLLGEEANFALVMTYEWGYTYGPPMAVAPLNEVKRVLDYAVTRIERNKIFMGIPNYGYDWSLPYVRGESRAKSISNEEAVDIARANNAEIMFDWEAQTPYFNYYDENGTEHIVYFEDARSIYAKLLTAAEYGFSGVSFWNIMRRFTVGNMLLNSLYNIVRV